ncbi:MAG TPA: acetate kinase [Candidatus Limnocylindria bacterium]|jgi:acetate kinase|nr:acetate kinase [Candidatus Limnocylindria bacterium]
MKILVLNSGSSSQKSCLYDIGKTLPEHPPAPVWEGKIEWDGSQADVQVRNLHGAHLKDRVKVESRSQAIGQLLDTLWNGTLRAVSAPSDIDVVGHRIVHGGKDLDKATAITPEVKSAIARMSTFAPLHNRAELEGVEIIEKRIGTVLQVAVFDTAFHSRLPEGAAIYPGPYEWLAQGIRRYGFHGINHQYCSERTAQLLGKNLRSLKLVTCHLGNGCSLAAIRAGRSVDTTMGFTPLEGLVMGTRSGSVDPGILTYLMRRGQLTGQQLDDLLNTKSGLLGISGISSDMRQIVAAMKDGHPRAKLAFEIFVHRLQAGIGAMMAVLGGIDALVFTAGIGENSPDVRAAACASFGFLGLKLDRAKNTQSSVDQEISLSDSTVHVLIVRAQEDWAIARDCWRLISARSRGRARAN